MPVVIDRVCVAVEVFILKPVCIYLIKSTSPPLRIQNPKTPKQKESLQRNKETFDFERMGDCRPLGFLLGLPFALVALVLSLVGAVIWVIGTVLSCLCPCCICFAGLANMAVGIVKLPVKVIRWFIEKIPC